jgi:dolichol-phosphate mannosyltransferase
MEKYPLEIIIPIFNEGKQVINLLKLFDEKIKTKFRILLCYDSEKDDIFDYKNNLNNFSFEIKLVKNPGQGPCSAIKEGFRFGKSDCVIVYPADDFININILDKMYSEFLNGNEIVVASRFMKGGSMKNCPLLKSILVRSASLSLYLFSSIPVRDASNGFRLFSRKLLNEIKIESNFGFSYSLELLVKCKRLKYKITEIPAIWEERKIGISRFKVFKWLPHYFKWYLYGLATTWLKKRKI